MSIQSLPNMQSVLACGRCYRAIGTLEQQVRLATGAEEVPPLVSEAGGEFPLVNGGLCVPCSGGCGILYCSDKCAAVSELLIDTRT